MESKELRIGNYINFGSTVSEVLGITVTDVMFKYSTGSEEKYAKLISEGIQPIPLTEEWLIKFGFVSTDNQKYNPEDEFAEQFYYELEDSGVKHRELICFPRHGWTVTLGNYGGEREFKYVHQIQNLFFALTGKELTVKN